MTHPTTIHTPNRAGSRLRAGLLLGAMSALCGPSFIEHLPDRSTSRKKVPDPERQQAAELKRIRKAERRASRQCPECGGSGETTTEIRARYGDPGEPCTRCDSTGRVSQ